MAQTIVVGWTWETGEADQEQAERVAELSGLRSDAMVNGLLRQRGHAANRLTRHDVLLDISSEAQHELALALELEPLLAAGFVKNRLPGEVQPAQGSVAGPPAEGVRAVHDGVSGP
ncbi:hypothetical protein ACFWOT_20440 [Streptomyces sp. NPDC058440]|uniref:hypothetical protein n=1 Tax=Streptomyces sp. NPDC058440 TaxID=3346501 RepID=UPI00364F951C